MSDLALFWDNQALAADVSLDGAALATDEGLRTAVIVSLFTDARARDDDPVPDGGDRRGWWGDALPVEPGDAIGSRLWLLAREKRLSSVLDHARSYAAEALSWLIADGIAAEVDVIAEAQGEQTLALGVQIRRPSGPGRLRFDFVWEATASGMTSRAV
jgi:phage gp46-like protein